MSRFIYVFFSHISPSRVSRHFYSFYDLSPLVDAELKPKESDKEKGARHDAQVLDILPVSPRVEPKGRQDDGARDINLESVFLLDQLQKRNLVHQQRLKCKVEERQLLEPRQVLGNRFCEKEMKKKIIEKKKKLLKTFSIPHFL